MAVRSISGPSGGVLPLSSAQASSSYPPTSADYIYRKILKQSIAAVCKQGGFDFVEASVLELLTHMINSYIVSLASTTRQMTEHAGRTISNPSDVTMALIDNGIPVMELIPFLQKCREHGTMLISSPKPGTAGNLPTPLHVGITRPHHAHIPDSMPSFPDPHTYIRTEISGDPELTYERVRENAAVLKRNTEVSLVNFMLRIHPSIPLFREQDAQVRKEARQILEDRERQKKAHIMARQAEMEAMKLTEELKKGAGGELPNIFNDDDQPMEEDQSEKNGHLEDIEAEEMFELKETENSLVLRRIPAYCQVLYPFLENRPYLSGLLTDGIGEENEEEASPPPSPSHAIHPANAAASAEETTIEDNPYMRQPGIRTPKMID